MNKKSPKDVTTRIYFRQEFTNSDLIRYFADLINNYKEKLAISNCWTIKITNSKFYFCMLVCNDDSDFLVLNTQIVIGDDMKLQVFQEGNEVSFNDLKWVLPIDKKLSRWSQLQNILSRYKVLHNAHSDTDICLIEKHLEKSLEELNKAYIIAESIDFAYTKNLEILTDQVRKIKNKNNRYSSCTIIMAFSLYSHYLEISLGLVNPLVEW